MLPVEAVPLSWTSSLLEMSTIMIASMPTLSLPGFFWVGCLPYIQSLLLSVLPGLVVALITREQFSFVGLRQAYLSSKPNTSRLSSRVVLFLFVPEEALREDMLQTTFGSEAQKSWVVSDHSKLEGLVSERDDRAMMLEAAEVQLIKEANRMSLHRKQGKTTGSTPETGGVPALEVPGRSRPKHRPTPVVGTKVDTIDWARKTLVALQSRVQKHREDSKTSTQPQGSAVFVAYSSIVAAQRAYCEANFHPVVSRAMPDRYIGVQPKEALWANLTLATSSRIFRASLATALAIAMILLWAIPIGFVGAISNISYLTDKVKFLRFLNNLPPSIIGLISGLLPPIAISTLISYVPKIFRCASFCCYS